jgi:hypothetical protein
LVQRETEFCTELAGVEKRILLMKSPHRAEKVFRMGSKSEAKQATTNHRPASDFDSLRRSGCSSAEPYPPHDFFRFNFNLPALQLVAIGSPVV